MDFLNPERLAKWKAVQPQYLADIMTINEVSNAEFFKIASATLPTLQSPDEAFTFAGEHHVSFKELGRASRIRFLAWVMHTFSEEQTKNFVAGLTFERPPEEVDESGGDGSDGRDKIAPVFYADILALAEALGPKIAAQMVDSQTLDAVAGASLEATAEFEMKGRMR